MKNSYAGPLQEMTRTTPTMLWNDSASITELTASMKDGALGATCNPVIALTVARQEMDHWQSRIAGLIREMPGATEDAVGWKLVEEITLRGAALLEPVFREYKGRQGRIALQTDPRFFADSRAILAQAETFSRLAPNIIVKIPVTRASLEAIEEATFQGISIMATVCFTVSQALAVGEAVERGLKRREARGEDTSEMAPVCAIMVGRLDDWLKVTADKLGIMSDPGCMEWAGVAVFKKAYRIYRERGYRTTLLSAAFRNHMHWSEFIGGEVIISPPYKWQKMFNASGIEVTPRMDNPVDPRILEELDRKFPDFRRAYEENGLSPEEFDSFGATARTLRQFIAACSDLAALIRDFQIPDPDKALTKPKANN